MPAPHDIALERALLGAVLMHPEARVELADSVPEANFYRVPHGRLWTVYGEIQPDVTPSRAHQGLARHGWEDEWDVARIMALTDGMPRGFDVESAAKQLRDLADRRRLLTLLERGKQRVVEADSAAEAATQLVEDVRATVTVQEGASHSLGSVVAAMVQTLDQPSDAATTGFDTLDRMGCGFRPGEFVILAGRPSQGKTALAQGMARATAGAGTHVWFASLEMSADALSLRWLASEARVDLSRFRGHQLTPADYERVTSGIAALDDLPIDVEDRGGMALGDLRRLVVGKRGVLIVDYLQLLRTPKAAMKYGSRVQEVGALSRGLKAIAHECGVTVLGLSQLSRAVESRSYKEPILSDLRDSGELEQDADQVWMLWRPPTYDPDELADRAVLKIAKHRNGPTGSIELVFNAPQVSFRERTVSDPQPEARSSRRAQPQEWNS